MTQFTTVIPAHGQGLCQCCMLSFMCSAQFTCHRMLQAGRSVYFIAEETAIKSLPAHSLWQWNFNSTLRLHSHICFAWMCAFLCYFLRNMHRAAHMQPANMCFHACILSCMKTRLLGGCIEVNEKWFCIEVNGPWFCIKVNGTWFYHWSQLLWLCIEVNGRDFALMPMDVILYWSQ